MGGSKKAAILCPGPSLRFALIRSLWTGSSRVVAVTDAILSEVPETTHWCHTENPTLDKRLAYRDQVVARKPIIWGLARWDERWRTMMKLQDYPRFELEDHADVLERLPYKTKIEDWSHGPTFHSIARCIADGFQEVNLFGCDWRGQTNFHPDTGAPLGKASKDPERRWAGERSLFERIAAEAQGEGFLVQRISSGMEPGLSGPLDDAGEAGGSLGGGDDGGGEPGDLDEEPDPDRHLGGVGRSHEAV